MQQLLQIEGTGKRLDTTSRRCGICVELGLSSMQQVSLFETSGERLSTLFRQC
jgi:hypothetical protein